jgi:uncharacterized membrane protein YfcA
VSRCDKKDWLLFASLHFSCYVFLALGIIVVKREYKHKEKHGYEFSPGDLKATPKNLIYLVSISFVGAIAASFCGVGPCFIFGPILFIIGIEAQVGTATGMYVTMYTTLAATIQVLFFELINLKYSYLVNIMTLIGTFLGIFFQNYILKTTKKVSYIVIILTSCIIFALMATTSMSVSEILKKRNEGQNIF